MANVGSGTSRIIVDADGEAATVTSNRLDVNAYLSATPTIDIGDVSLLLGGTAADTGLGTYGAQTLRVTLASDDYQFGAHDDGASSTGSIHAKLRSIFNSLAILPNIQTYTSSTSQVVAHASTTTGGEYAEGDGGFMATGVRNDTLATLVSVDHDHAPLQVNASGALYVDIADGGQLDTIIDTLETTLTAIETDQAAIEALLITIDSDTDAIKTAVQILDDWDDSNYANVNLNLAGSDAPTGGGVESGALRVTLANDSTGVISIDDGGNTITVDGTVTANLGTTDNAVLDAMVINLASIETLLTGIDSDTNNTQGFLSNLSGAQYVDDADWTDSTSKHLLVGGLYQSSMQSVTDGDVAPFQVDANGVIKVAHAITGGADGVTTVSSAGTDVVLGGDVACKKIDIQAQTDNTGLIAVGFTGVDATEATGTGVILYAGDTYSLEMVNLNLIYIDSTVSGEGVRYTYFT
jgi:hypothetical protein